MTGFGSDRVTDQADFCTSMAMNRSWPGPFVFTIKTRPSYACDSKGTAKGALSVKCYVLASSAATVSQPSGALSADFGPSAEAVVALKAPKTGISFPAGCPR